MSWFISNPISAEDSDTPQASVSYSVFGDTSISTKVRALWDVHLERRTDRRIVGEGAERAIM